MQAANVAAETARKAAESAATAARTAADSASSLASLEALKDLGSQYSGIYCKDTDLVTTTVKVCVCIYTFVCFGVHIQTHIWYTHVPHEIYCTVTVYVCMYV